MKFIEHSSARSLLIWRIVFLFAPLACFAGIWLTLRYDPNTQLDLQIDRAAAIKRAGAFATAQGVDVASWTSACKVEVNNDQYFYLRVHENEDTPLARRLAPEAVVRVLFVDYESGKTFGTTLAPDGTPLGFRRDMPDTRTETAGGAVTITNDEAAPAAQVETNADAARVIADAALALIAAEQNLPVASFAAPVLKEDRADDGNQIRRHYTYRLNLPASPELELDQRISVASGEVVGQEVTTKINDDYAKANFLNHQTAHIVGMTLYVILIILLLLYSFYRYIQLTRQKEAPHARSLLVAGIFGASFLIFALQTDFQILSPGGNTKAGYWIMLIFGGGMTFLLMGLGVGIAYGAGEGTVREAYPGRLTSLDALLTGRIFSRNVARAVLVGACLGAWLVLFHNLSVAPWFARADAGMGLSSIYEIFYGRFTALIPIINPPAGGLMIAISALLLPLALFQRRIQRDRRFFIVLALLCCLANLGTVLQSQPMPFAASLMQTVTVAGVLLVGFFFFDLLTAIVATAVPSLITTATYFVTQPSVSLRQTGWISIGIACLIVIVETYFIFRGRTLTEDEVRPLYARHLAERVRMQSEVSAAREAQVRLMPAVLPRLSGLSVAAECRPARTVGGDFFDVFSLDEKRIGVFVAEGGERGLEAALTIAFAKGFLMPRLKSNQTPGEVVCSLQTQLAPLLDLNQALGLAYAVFDTQTGRLDYARTGNYPRVVIRHTNGDIISGDTEQVWNLTSSSEAMPEDENANGNSDGNSPSTDCLIHEATFSFSAGDAAIIITDGIAKTLPNNAALAKLAADITRLDDGGANKKNARGITSPPEELSLKQAPQTEVPLRRALAGALQVQAKRARKLGIEDDLTAVVLRYDKLSQNSF